MSEQFGQDTRKQTVSRPQSTLRSTYVYVTLVLHVSTLKLSVKVIGRPSAADSCRCFYRINRKIIQYLKHLTGIHCLSVASQRTCGKLYIPRMRVHTRDDVSEYFILYNNILKLKYSLHYIDYL
jgi:hypothetical protein